jgi:copper chaperone NosL
MVNGRTELADLQETKKRVSRGGLVLALYAGLLLAGSIFLPWWRMECRAPQYGARVLIVEVTPGATSGDTKEIDNLGHYVGMRSMQTFAKLERQLGPYALILAALVAFSLPFLPRKWMRITAVVAILLVPVLFAIDLYAWQKYAAKNLDPTAALSLIQDRIQTKLVGKYSVAQFNVKATFQEGFWFSVIAGLNVLGFLFIEKERGSGL